MVEKMAMVVGRRLQARRWTLGEMVQVRGGRGGGGRGGGDATIVFPQGISSCRSPAAAVTTSPVRGFLGGVAQGTSTPTVAFSVFLRRVIRGAAHVGR